MTRDVAEASALRAMAIGGVGMLLGGAFILSTAFDVGAALRGRVVDSGALEVVALALAALIAVLAGFVFVRGLVVREEASGGADPPSIALVTLVTVPLAALALGGYSHAHPPDKQLRDPALPYAFDYPGQWERDPAQDLPDTGASGYVAGVSKQVEGGVTQGVLVQVFRYDELETLDDHVRRQIGQAGFAVAGEYRGAVDGRPALKIDFALSTGAQAGSQVLVRAGRHVYWITCIYRDGTQRGRDGCAKVLETFRIGGLR